MPKLINMLRANDFNFHSKAEYALPDYLGAICDLDLPVFDVSNVADYMAVNVSRFKESIRDVVTSALPPFPLCWMECKVTERGYLPSALVRAGALLTTLDIREYSESQKSEVAGRLRVPPERRYDMSKASWLVRGEFSSLTDNGVLGCLHSFAYFLLDQNGSILRPMLAGHLVDGPLDAEQESGLSMIALEMMSVFGMACAFMSCKNVTVSEHAPDKKVAAARRRRNKPPMAKYYTLEIEPMKRVLRSEGGSDELGLKRALHICRGHFADYSEERPLFGKVSGRFWIPAHVRGSKDAGEIKKDYRVKGATGLDGDENKTN